MKNLLLSIVSLLLITPWVNAQSNFYQDINNIYSNVPLFQVKDSLKNGFQKQIDRLEILQGPRL